MNVINTFRSENTLVRAEVRDIDGSYVVHYFDRNGQIHHTTSYTDLNEALNRAESWPKQTLNG